MLIRPAVQFLLLRLLRAKSSSVLVPVPPDQPVSLTAIHAYQASINQQRAELVMAAAPGRPARELDIIANQRPYDGWVLAVLLLDQVAALRLSAVTNAKNRPGEDAAQKTLHQAVTHGTHKRLADGYKVFGILDGPTATSVRAMTLPSL